METLNLNQNELHNLQIWACKVVSRINNKFFQLENGQIASDAYAVDIQDGKVRIYDGLSEDVYCETSEEIDNWALDCEEVYSD
jgi:hypothetical protein